MIARISCSRTSNETSCSAFTPPNERATFSTTRTGPPMSRCGCIGGARASGGLLRRRDREGLRVGDAQVGADLADAAVLELDLRLDEALLLPAVERVDQHAVLVGDEAAPHL